MSPQTFSQFAEVWKEPHVVAKGFALAESIDYCLKPLIARFGDRLLEAVAPFLRSMIIAAVDTEGRARALSSG